MIPGHDPGQAVAPEPPPKSRPGHREEVLTPGRAVQQSFEA